MKHIVKFKSIESLNNFIKNEPIIVDKVLTKLNVVVFEIEEDFETEIDKMRQNDDILFFEENRVLKLDYEVEPTNKPISSFDVDGSSTYMGDIDGMPEYSTHLELLNTINYDQVETLNSFETTSTGSGVNVCVLDTGVLANNFFLTDKVTANNSFNNGDNTDESGHGTYCSLLICGEKYGVARDANIIPYKVLDKNKSGDLSDILSAIDHVIDGYDASTPTIMNLSLGISPSVAYPKVERDSTNTNDQFDNLYLDSIKQAVNTGIHVVLAAGNGFLNQSTFIGPMESKYTNGSLNLQEITDGKAINSDAGQGVPIVVGSVDSRSNLMNSDPTKLSEFSNYGTGNTIQSIGGNLILPDWYITDIGQSVGVTVKNGTSFSAPIVTGLLALYLENNPDATPDQARHWLISNTVHDNIKNIMTSIEFDKIETKFTWTKSTSVLKIDRVDSKNLLLSPGMKVQIHAPRDYNDYKFSDNTGVFVKNYLKKIAESGSYHWTVVSATDNSISLSVDDIPTEIHDTLADAEDTEQIRFTINIFSESDSHELKDGIKKWQDMNTGNRLEYVESLNVANNSDQFFVVSNVGQTPNICAYNPYQPYKIDWKNINKLDIKTFFDQTNSLDKVTIQTMRGETHHAVTFRLGSGQFPSGVSIDVNGSIQVDVELYEKTTEQEYEVEIIATNGYAEFTRTMSVVDTHELVYTETPVDKLDFTNFLWYDCNNENIILNETEDFKEVIYVINDKCIVYNNSMPANKIPNELKELVNIRLYLTTPEYSSLNITEKNMRPSGHGYLMESC
jgi:hypothetical protein